MADQYKNKVVTGVWPTRGGHFNTMPFDMKAVQVLRQIADETEAEIKAGRLGGKFLIRQRKEEGIATSKSKAPYFLEAVPASEVQAFEAKKFTHSDENSGL